MNFPSLLKIAFRALQKNKFRTFLTMLGIIIGVASVIAMLAIGAGFQTKYSVATVRHGLQYDHYPAKQ